MTLLHWLNKTFYTFDDSIFRATYDLELKMPWVAKLARFISYFGDHGIFFIALAAVLLVFRKTRKIGFTVGLAILFEFILNDLILKNIIARPRHFWDEASPYYEMWLYAKGTFHTSYSFPSGHTAVATAAGVSLFLCCNKKYSWAFLLIPVLMAWSRVGLFVHYPSDVVASMIINGALTVGAYYTAKQLFKIKYIKPLLEGDSLF